MLASPAAPGAKGAVPAPAEAAAGIAAPAQTWVSTGVSQPIDVAPPPKSAAGGLTAVGVVTTSFWVGCAMSAVIGGAKLVSNFMEMRQLRKEEEVRIIRHPPLSLFQLLAQLGIALL